MKNNPTKKKGSTIRSMSVVMGILFILSAIFAGIAVAVPQEASNFSPFGTAEAEDLTDTVTKIAELSSNSGCTDSTTTIQSGQTESVMIENGDKGSIELDDWVSMSFDLYVNVENSDDIFTITIEDEDDAANYVEITISAKLSGVCKVVVEDNAPGKSESKETEEKDLSNDQTMIDHWLLVEVKITKTDKATDGSAQEISVAIGGDDFIEKFILYSYEISGKISVRKFNGLTVAVPGSADRIYTDQWSADGQAGGTTGLNVTWIVLIALFLVLATIIVFRRKQATQAVARVGNKFTGKSGGGKK